MKRDPILRQSFETDRFTLRSVGVIEAMRITNPWRHDTEIMTGLFQSGKPMGLLPWFAKGPIPRSSRRFSHAIVPKGTDTPIGLHGLKLYGYRSALCSVALHDREWWGKNVVVEVRAALMNRFFRHAEVERFYGIVDARNASSVFSYRKLGFSHCGTWHRHRQNPVTGDVIDFLFFEIFRDQWQSGPYWSDADGA